MVRYFFVRKEIPITDTFIRGLFLRHENGFRRHRFPKRPIVFHKDHRRAVILQQPFDLQSGIEVEIVQRFVPNVEMRLFAETFGEEDLLFLSFGIRSDIPFEVFFGKAEFIEYAPEQVFVHGVLSCKVGDSSAGTCRLRYVRDGQPGSEQCRSQMRDIFARNQF